MADVPVSEADVLSIAERRETAKGSCFLYLEAVSELARASKSDLQIEVDERISELRISRLPASWRWPEGIQTLTGFVSDLLCKAGILSAAEQKGSYWYSFGVRLGPEWNAENQLPLAYHHWLMGCDHASSEWVRMGRSIVTPKNTATLSKLLVAAFSKYGRLLAMVVIRLAWTPTKVAPRDFENKRGGWVRIE